MKKYILIFLFILNISCQEKDVSGHWHVISLNSPKSFYYPVDISKDSVAYWGKNTIFKSDEGKVSKKDKMLCFPFECGSGVFDYKLVEDKLLLTNPEGYGDYVGIRSDCTPLKDFKSNFKIDVEFPVLYKKTTAFKFVEIPENYPLFETIIFGKTKYDAFFKQKKMYQVENEFIDLKDMDSWIQKVQNRTEKEAVKFLKFRLIADSSTKTEEINKLLEVFKQNGIKNLYITLLPIENTKESLDFIYLKLEEPFEKGIELHEIINIKNYENI
ncbi:hypothetical protein [Aureivirga sp. CE67]|uniref:hypothetical protein n=1 Tax=Aureivirga sp. CE67 TaxID=1788983 RepID=UPI0018CA4E97|nr:hypothetical protein [Aureivirga sp. CE67]